MESLWERETELPDYAPLYGEAMADVAIVGGGMAGLLTGYELNQRGISCAILERGRIASGVTGKTTAKITLQHGLIYKRLLESVGREQAAQYAAANRRALDRYAEIIRQKGIDCGFKRLPAHVYSTKETAPLYDEIRAAASLGIDAEFVRETELPFPVKGAVRFPDQAQFHPLEFLKEIVKELRIYEHTEAMEISREGVRTLEGRVSAPYVVVATHYPILDAPGYYFLRMHQQRSYVLALEGAKSLEGMYIGAEAGSYSLRSAGKYLLLGGAGHRTGQHEDGGSYQALRTAAGHFYPDATVAAEWSAQDCMTADGIPYIGRYSEKTPRLFAATGFNKWGMTSSMVSALILSAMIAGETHPFAQVFTPQRFNTAGNAVLMKDGAKAIKDLLVKPLVPPKETLDALSPGHGGIVKYDGHKTGVYKNEEGECFIVSPKCTHLGCELSWNPDEKTWDCPCHGSRFRYDGSPLDTPAQKGLDRF